VKPSDLHSAAKAELFDAVDWYDDKREGLGKELMEEVQQALQYLEIRPHIGPYLGKGPYRFYRVKRFPYLIYYEELEKSIWVVAIAHERRKPGYWRKRTRE
jgi:toxin ParE1/3/4